MWAKEMFREMVDTNDKGFDIFFKMYYFWEIDSVTNFSDVLAIREHIDIDYSWLEELVLMPTMYIFW